MWSTFTKSVMASISVSALRRTSVHFVNPGIKVNGKYFRDVLLTRHLLPEIRQYSEYFTSSRKELPHSEFPKLCIRNLTHQISSHFHCGHLTVRICTRLIMLYGNHAGQGRWRTSRSCGSASCTNGIILINMWSTLQSSSGTRGYKLVLPLTDHSLSINM